MFLSEEKYDSWWINEWNVSPHITTLYMSFMNVYGERMIDTLCIYLSIHVSVTVYLIQWLVLCMEIMCNYPSDSWTSPFPHCPFVKTPANNIKNIFTLLRWITIMIFPSRCLHYKPWKVYVLILLPVGSREAPVGHIDYYISSILLSLMIIKA